MDSRAPSRSAIHQNDIGLHARAELRAAGGEPSHLTGLQKALSIESLDLCEPKSRHIFRKGIDARICGHERAGGHSRDSTLVVFRYAEWDRFVQIQKRVTCARRTTLFEHS